MSDAELKQQRILLNLYKNLKAIVSGTTASQSPWD